MMAYAREPLVVHPDRFLLLGADGSTPAGNSAGPDGAVTVAGGDARTLELQFSARAGFECTREMRLDPRAALTLHDSPVALAPVPFRPL